MNGFQATNSSSGAPTMNGLLAPARGQHNRAASLPVFAQPTQQNGGAFQEGGQNGAQQGERRGHGYQSSFSGGMGNGFGNGYGEMSNGLNGWAEEEIVGN